MRWPAPPPSFVGFPPDSIDRPWAVLCRPVGAWDWKPFARLGRRLGLCYDASLGLWTRNHLPTQGVALGYVMPPRWGLGLGTFCQPRALPWVTGVISFPPSSPQELRSRRPGPPWSAVASATAFFRRIPAGFHGGVEPPHSKAPQTRRLPLHLAFFTSSATRGTRRRGSRSLSPKRSDLLAQPHEGHGN